MAMDNAALVTGASSGIGYELCRVLAGHGYNVVLVSRDREKLDTAASELRRQFHVETQVIPADLSRCGAAQELYDQVKAKEIQVEVLVNNAGFGVHGPFVETPLDEEIGLIHVNAVSVAVLCKLFGADMARRARGRILNVASMAAFEAGPFMSNYYASKAYVLLLSEGLHRELKARGVCVSALCPGSTETGFFNRAGMTSARLFRSPLKMKAADVARIGVAGLMKGKTIVIPGLANRLLNFSVRLAPRALCASIAQRLHE
jgi:uncharacterized protein